MLWWLIYDISQNKGRNKVASCCKNYGLNRMQKSAFVGYLTKNKAEMLMGEVAKYIDLQNDCIFLLPACRNCFSQKLIKGKFDKKIVEKVNFIIVS